MAPVTPAPAETAALLPQCRGRYKPWFGKVNHNVGLTMLAKTGDGLSVGLWNGAVMATWLYLIENNSNKAVGIAEGFFGIFCVVSGLPSGWLADRMRRDRLLRIFGCIMLVSIALTTVAVLLPSRDLDIVGVQVRSQYLLILAAMILWGVSEGYGPAVDAIFADSIPTGQRDGIYTWAFSLATLGYSAGQFIAAGLMYYWGNSWTIMSLRNVILVGMATSVLSSSTLFFFDDEGTLGEESEAINHSASVADLEAAAASGQKLVYSWSSINFLLPAILLFSDAIFGLAAGMTVKFFPLYFKNAVHLSPATTNLVMAATPLLLAPFSFMARFSGRLIGRVQTIALFEAVGVGCMLYMGRVPGCWTQLHLIIPLYAVRCTANNATYALQTSITMDYVPKSSRGKWNSLDSMMMAGWSASAVLGGFLLDHHGFGTTFTITALLQGLGVSILIPLSFMGDPAAKRHKDLPVSLEAAETVAAAMAEEAGGQLSAPLLSPAASHSHPRADMRGRREISEYARNYLS